MEEILLTDNEILELVPDGMKQPQSIVNRLHTDGFARARLVRGRVVLEREHYLAVCRGEFGSKTEKAHNERPRVKRRELVA